MRFALLGDHPDGLEMARALVATGRHQLLAYCGRARGAEFLRGLGLAVKPVGDMEEVLADPAVEGVIVAGRLDVRPAQLRRALQSERSVLCVHPADDSPDIAYEAAMIQSDTHQKLLPLLPASFHPGIVRLVDLLQAEEKSLGQPRLIELDIWSKGTALLEAEPAGRKPSFPAWDVLRTLAGEVAEVSAFTSQEDLAAQEPVLLMGRFEKAGLFQARLLPQQFESRWRLAVVGSRGQAELIFSDEPFGPARLTWQDQAGQRHEQTWETWNPWATLAEIFESGGGLSWQDEIRCLELDDAARRSVHQRRAIALEYQAADEEVGFKGTMTLVGCAMLWGILLLAIITPIPHLRWLIVPILVVFLALQLLRWVIPQKKK